MQQFANIYQFAVGIDSMGSASYCDLCDSTIHYGDQATVVEDEGGVSITTCRSCLAKLVEEDK